MGDFFDLHRHDEFSLFDGFGKADDLAELAKELGYSALGLTNHGNMSGLVKMYNGCKKAGIKPVLGVEGYFLPKYKEQDRGFHLILVAKNEKGFQNLNRIQYEGEKQKFYNPIWDFSIIEKYSDGLICTSACVAGYLAQCIKNDKIANAKKFVKKMVDIFGDDFYIEIQPYVVDEAGFQENVNIKSIEIAKEFGVKCILTSDSHRGKKEDYPSYLKLHQIAGHSEDWVEKTYKQRYMPSKIEIMKRFVKMHEKDYGQVKAKKMAIEMANNLAEIEDKVCDDIFAEFKASLPKYDETRESKDVLKEEIKAGLKQRGKTSKKYIKRVMEEYDTITYLNFEDYFLMVMDYVKWAKSKGIYVGPGRGSGCNYVSNYALKITEVDSLKFGLEPRRFLMKERKKMPDIDIDFETDRREEVIRYLLNKYPGHSARICSYGLYKVDNLTNDLAKVCGLPIDKNIDEAERKQNKAAIAEIKSHINKYIVEGFINMEELLNDSMSDYYNRLYDDIIIHFTKLYEKIRYIGTHAAGVAIAGENILNRTTLRIDKNTGDVYTCYDLVDMESLNVIKFDMLGLSTMSEVGECRKLIGVDEFDESILEDEKVIANFASGNCDGIFQLDKKSAQNLLVDIGTDSFTDVVAGTAINRPGPLSQGIPKIYAENKRKFLDGEEYEGSYFEKYLGKTYGTIIYQEQIMQMAVDIANMSWDEAHKITKMKIGVSKFNDYFENDYPIYEAAFVKGAKAFGVSEDEAKEIFKKFYEYSFNEGHSVGYSLISAEQMYHKVYYPAFFWFAKIKYSNKENYMKYSIDAVKDGIVLFLPHVNYSNSKTRLRKVEGEYCIQLGLSDIKDVGPAAAVVIQQERQKNGIFTSYDNFYDRCKSRAVTSRVVETLKKDGALEFNKKTYLSRITKYNSTLLAKSL